MDNSPISCSLPPQDGQPCLAATALSRPEPDEVSHTIRRLGCSPYTLSCATQLISAMLHWLGNHAEGCCAVALHVPSPFSLRQAWSPPPWDGRDLDHTFVVSPGPGGGVLRHMGADWIKQIPSEASTLQLPSWAPCLSPGLSDVSLREEIAGRAPLPGY